MKTKLIILALFVSSITFAQKSFFEAIEANGEDAVYQEYWKVNKNDKDKYEISGKLFEVTIEPVFYKDMTSGFEIRKLEDSESRIGFNYTNNNHEKMIGYPNTYCFLSIPSNMGVVIIEDYIFELSDISEDRLSFKGINTIYIKKGSGDKGGKPKKKKKKKSKFFKKLGQAALSSVIGMDVSKTQDKDVKKALSLDLDTYITDYLKALKAKQDAYTLSSKDKKDIATLDQSRIDRKAYIKRYNDSLYNSDTYRRGREMKARADGASERNYVKLVNKSGRTVYVSRYSGAGTGAPAGTRISNGGSVNSWSCSTDAYLQGGTPSNPTSTNIKVYSANSKCGGTVTIN